MADSMHQVVFEWPQTGPNTVIVTGTFDKWSSSRKLTKTATGFVGTAEIPWNEKILYKYIVDGDWSLVYGKPVETERRTGFVNHVYIAPPKPPVVLPTSKPEPVIAHPTDEAVGSAKASEVVDKNCNLPTTASPAIAIASPVAEESGNEATETSVAPLTADSDREPVHMDVGEVLIADAKSDSGTTAVADPELTADIIHTPIPTIKVDDTSPNKEREAQRVEKAKGKPSPLPTTPTKGEVFPSVSPPSSPSRFGSLRGSGRKKRTSIFAKLKEIFHSDKDTNKSGKEKAETKT